jgi:type IV secretory pathway TraG/TraD family ATPase VirD4
VVLWCDEAASFGRVESLINAYSTARAYGVQVVTLWTDIEAVIDLYGARAKSLIANSAFQVWLPTKELNTAKHLSEMGGFRDALSQSKNLNWGYGANAVPQISETTSQVRREVMTVSEVLDLPMDEGIAIVRGVPGLIRIRHVPYFRQSRFDGWYGKNPFYE